MQAAVAAIRHLASSLPRRRFGAMLCAALLCAASRAAESDDGSGRDLTGLNLEQLMNLDVETPHVFLKSAAKRPPP